MTFQFHRVTPTVQDWSVIEIAPDSMCYFTEQWDAYLKRMHWRLFAVEVSQDNQRIGFFLGSVAGWPFKMISAPSMGTGTFSQGLCLNREVAPSERIQIYQELVKWIFAHHWAQYIMVCDWRLRNDSKEWIDGWRHPLLDSMGVYYNQRTTFYLDTRRPLEELWANLSYKSCKYSINKAKKAGLYVKCVEKEEDIHAFVKQHHDHILDVLDRKKNKGLPCQREKNMEALCQSLFPNRVLMLQVLGTAEDGQEHSMASAIFALDKNGSSYFTSGSYQRFMHYCPNELLLWEAIKMLNERGAGDLIFGGVAHYKKKFDPTYAFVPVMIFSRWKALLGLRKWTKQMYVKLIHWVYKR